MRIFPAILGSALCAALLAAGCASRMEAPPPGRAPEAAEIIFPQVAEAFLKQDYSLLEHGIGAELKTRLTRENFNAMLRQLEKSGRIESVSYLARLRHALVISEFWKIVCRRENAEHEIIYTDKLLRVVVGRLDNRMQIIGMVLQ